MKKADVLIMAAGGGDRFGGREPKQFTSLGDRSMLAWAIEPFANHDRVKSITVVVAADQIGRTRDIAKSYADLKVVEGGETRQQSVQLGLASLRSESSYVLVHDAARPCVSTSLIDRLLDAFDECDAAVPTMPAVDTLVHEANQQVDALLDRANITGVQTPQGFKTDLLRRAHRTAEARGFLASDDGSLVLALGETLRTVPGERTNMKITFDDDMKIAEAILALQKQR